MDLEFVLQKLASKRKIFHSEADFQFALAWEIKQVYPLAEVRMEYTPVFAPNMHIDIVVFYNGLIYPIELKYKTVSTNITEGQEIFLLKNHGALDFGRYDFLRDIERIEFCKEKWSSFSKGYAVLLTNDLRYSKEKSKNKQTIDQNFKICDGVTKTGELTWLENSKTIAIKGREKPIYLKGSYFFKWKEYDKNINEDNKTFNYCLIEVK